ncbi:hypothetical protein IWZ00DRAFT_322320 [Phyllosticta capitalensis]|uniref:Secreted protein n=1 Tax=Phyllosticta capitalensis TaxID=121624 RepID=A0ABR1YI08_9PEZI
MILLLVLIAIHLTVGYTVQLILTPVSQHQRLAKHRRAWKTEPPKAASAPLPPVDDMQDIHVRVPISLRMLLPDAAEIPSHSEDMHQNSFPRKTPCRYECAYRPSSHTRRLGQRSRETGERLPSAALPLRAYQFGCTCASGHPLSMR